jgi:DNA-binding protein H-NS
MTEGIQSLIFDFFGPWRGLELPRIVLWTEAAFDDDKLFGCKKMKFHDLNSMSVDELWSLYEFVHLELARRISAEKERLDQKLRQLGLVAEPHKMGQARRPYPKVFPKYKNPANPSQTWAGRGKRPRWLTAQIKSGKQIDDFRIDLATA